MALSETKYVLPLSKRAEHSNIIPGNPVVFTKDAVILTCTLQLSPGVAGHLQMKSLEAQARLHGCKVLFWHQTPRVKNNTWSLRSTFHSKQPALWEKFLAASITECYVCLPRWNTLVLHPTKRKPCKVESCGSYMTQTWRVLHPEHKLSILRCLALQRRGSDRPTAGFGSKSSASLNPEVIGIWCQGVERGGGCSSATHPRVLA